MNSASRDVRIRRMTLSDLDQVMAVAESLKQVPCWPRSVFQFALQPEAVPARIALVAEDPETSVLTGFTVASLLPPQAELEIIAIATQYQRHGLAGRLFTQLAAELGKIQGNEVILEVRASNHPALGLYRKLGFTETGRRPRYYHDPVEDAILMQLRL